MKTLRNTTLDFVAGVDVQAFIVAVQTVLNRYYFGRLIKLKFHRESMYDQIVMTAEIEYPPLGCFKTNEVNPTKFRIQRTIHAEDIDHILKQGEISSQSYIKHTVEDIIYNLALVQQEEPKEEPKAS